MALDLPTGHFCRAVCVPGALCGAGCGEIVPAPSLSAPSPTAAALEMHGRLEALDAYTAAGLKFLRYPADNQVDPAGKTGMA